MERQGKEDVKLPTLDKKSKSIFVNESNNENP
jgi:hypothetical protein